MDDQGKTPESEFDIPKLERGLEAIEEQAVEMKPASEARANETPKPASPTISVDPQSLAQPAAALSSDDQTTDVFSGKQTKNQPTKAEQKQWINKAKEVIAKTHDDPRAQASALSRVKADYIKANFSKSLKVTEGG